jgi:hypothetical protein
MSSLAGIDDPTALSDGELGLLLNRLEREERHVSKRRSTLHDQMNFVQAGGFAAEGKADEQLAQLRAREHDLSHQRQILHLQIDVLRAERSRRRVGP